MNGEENLSLQDTISALTQDFEQESPDVDDETVEFKEDYYDVKKYKEEIGSFVKRKRVELDILSNMEANYVSLKNSIFAGTTTSDEERYPHAAEMFKVYKSAIIESSLSGYSALLEITGRVLIQLSKYLN